LEGVTTESVPRGGTLIGDAIRTALSDVFDNKASQYRDLVLITDGEDHESFPVEAAREAGLRKIRIIAIGLGDENVGKRMAILLFEKGQGEVVTAPVIRSEIGGGRVQISGRMTTTEANDVALLLRSGSLAAPMEIVEERTVGPSLGAENIARGFDSVTWGFVVVVAFMCLYYAVFGVISSLALAFNLALLVAVLSMLQATLTLPGMAAMALTLGMAIDANVLINERVREELRGGASPQAAIHAGYERAWGTILDSNVTTLIAGVALFLFGSGPVRGFAVVHVVGILTSMFSAVLFSRGLVNLWYGRQRKLSKVSIGTVWQPK
ncbi:MAG: protein translocase subunit SecD, partial [Burkholderiaceae bacterium]